MKRLVAAAKRPSGRNLCPVSLETVQKDASALVKQLKYNVEGVGRCDEIPADAKAEVLDLLKALQESLEGLIENF